MSPSKVKRYHYEYKKNGAGCVLLAFAPPTGFRYVEVRERRTAQDYAEFMQTLLARHYPEVESIRLVQDNLNTHTPGSFYEVLPPGQAFALAQRFDSTTRRRKGRGSTWQKSNLRPSRNSAWIGAFPRSRRCAAKCAPGRINAIRRAKRSPGSSHNQPPERNYNDTIRMYRNLLERPLSGLSNKSLNDGATECRAIKSHRTHECSRTLLKDHLVSDSQVYRPIP